MKKIFTLLLCVITIAAISQPIGRDKVVLEIGTGTWCPYCPGAAMGADDLIDAGCDVAVIEYHDGDSFSTADGDARISYYNITGFPTAFFDGVLDYVGGSSSQSMYNNYLPLYNQRIAIPSDFFMEIYGENTGGDNYSVSVMLDNVNGNTNPNLVVHLALTESEIAYSWQGQSELNFVQRLMVPDHQGTAVDFAGGNSQQIDLTFTVDPTWNLAHCELVAFVQDSQTKEIQQGIKVMIDNLQPFQATAQFGCNTQMPCVTSDVEYYDNSLGNVTNWTWTFEGGIPATSTDPNPVVTYNSTGLYDVELIVYDGEVYDTLTQVDYIEVITTPVQANAPQGPQDPCAGESGLLYSTDAVPYTDTYEWEVSPSNAGTLTPNGTEATLDLDPAFSGVYSVKVRADNYCGEGVWSNTLDAEAHYVPAIFTLSEGSGYCEGGPGVMVSLDGSETGIDYELYLDNQPTGQVIPGTGNSLDFGYQTETGIYTCMATTDYCSELMMGNSYIFVLNVPGQAGIPVGDDVVCNEVESTEYVTSGATDATAYYWILEPLEAGEINGSDEFGTVFWNHDFDGTATIKVQGTNNCGDGVFSEELQVLVKEEPAPVVSGEEWACDNTSGHIYSTPEVSGNIYTWEVTGGEITAGLGTHEIQVTWGEPGQGTVTVTETDAEGCSEVSAGFPVTIDDCTSLIENEEGGVTIYPNPARNVLNIKSYGQLSGEITYSIVSTLGKVMMEGNMYLENGKNDVQISELPLGIYFLRMIDEEGTIVDKKFSTIR
jgi:PKD repeat protein